ncbi:MAG: hypothetical protein VYE22_25850 [Myxococcota bacterium]|nr:hypothetical protein [Myxococcota bacterium]
MKYLRALFALSFLLVAGCDDGSIPPPTDSGVRMDTGVVPTDSGPPEPMCDNWERDGDETGIDCGGSCPGCEDGSPCTASDDCESDVCQRGFCLVPSCDDGVRNGTETGTDCGGESCPLCGGGEPCTSNDECLSGRCRGGMCEASSCEDGRQNSDETDVDCGGATCPPCDGGLTCLTREDCVSGICAAGTCTTPACNDSRQNQDETSVDCGGATCPGCRDGLACNIDMDCENGRCVDGGCISCMDRTRNGDETGLDCGGTVCDACADGQTCAVDGDCASGVCESGLCISCGDGVQNQDETDVDCGGATCGGCQNGLTCFVDADCASNDCDGGFCRGVADTCTDAFVLADGRNVVNWTAYTNDYWSSAAPSCRSFSTVDGPDLVMTYTATVDGIVEYSFENPGDETIVTVVTDQPCGSTTELHCNDVFSGPLAGDFPVTTGTTYTIYFLDMDSFPASGPPDPLVVNIREVDGRCRDGVANNMETDVDCGGPICPSCTSGQTCGMNDDCVSNICMGGTCNAPGCGDGTQNGLETDLDCGGGSCMGCAPGLMCMVGRDCASGVCSGGVCQAPTCSDGVRNGDETDVDCGGPIGPGGCPRCPDFRLCDTATDCMTATCTMGVCGTIGCVPFSGRSTDSFGYFGCTVSGATLPCPDISVTGTPVTLSDDDNQNVPIGFPFSFYGTSYSSVDIQSNGGITFDPGYLTLGNTCLPRTSTPRNMVAVFWDDLNPAISGGQIRYETRGVAPNRQFIVRWDTALCCSGTDRGVFSVVLNEGSNDIDVCYPDTGFSNASRDAGLSATAGINGPSDSLEYSCNTADLTDGLYVRYIHPSP